MSELKIFLTSWEDFKWKSHTVVGSSKSKSCTNTSSGGSVSKSSGSSSTIFFGFSSFFFLFALPGGLNSIKKNENHKKKIQISFIFIKR